MRSLILFRHGKSDWDATFKTDHERPLAHRGTEAARCMGRLLQKADEVPDLAITSSAVRARDTVHLAAAAGHWACPIHIDPFLYETTPEEVLPWLRKLGANPHSLLLTGHEPTWSELAGLLTGGIGLKVPTGTMLRIDLPIENWSRVDRKIGQLRWLLPPKVVCRFEARTRGR